jgi:hypothetical protein
LWVRPQLVVTSRRVIYQLDPNHLGCSELGRCPSELNVITTLHERKIIIQSKIRRDSWRRTSITLFLRREAFITRKIKKSTLGVDSATDGQRSTPLAPTLVFVLILRVLDA